MDDAVLDTEVFRGMVGRLERFVDPFVEQLKRSERRQHAWEYVAGPLSDVERKNAESIAYHHDQDRQPLPKFVGQLPWDHGALLAELTRQVGAELGEADGVLVFDPSAFSKKGVGTRQEAPEEVRRSAGGAFSHAASTGFGDARPARHKVAAHRVEECLQRAKSEAGLADYQVRTWIGWHHHQTFSLIAAWFLTQEKRRGEKIHSSHHRASRSFDHRLVAA
jgi:SRSO17 transposase